MKLRKKNVFIILLGVISFLSTTLFLFFVHQLHVIPFRYLFSVAILFYLLDVGILFCFWKKSKILYTLGVFFFILFVVVQGVGIFYIQKTDSFLDMAFGNSSKYETTFYVVGLNSSNYESISSFQEKKIGYYRNVPNIALAFNKLKEAISYEEVECNDLYTLFDLLRDGSYDGVLIDQNFYEFVFESIKTLKKDDYKVVYSFQLELQEEEEQVSKKGDSFHVYIGGADFTELFNDFNMIVTINKNTHKVLLTSTPRDFYIPVNGKGGAKDILGYHAVWGIHTSRKSLEDFYQVSIPYYVKINTKSLVGLVDTVGSVSFCSDINFTTTHALVTGTYDDTKGQKLYVKSGCHEYNGIQILTIARERLAFPGGDRKRQENCQQIMVNLFKKLLSVDNLMNYSNVLKAIGDLYSTNIPREVITDLANTTLSDGVSWTFETQSVNGTDGTGPVHLSNLMGYVMHPDMNTVNAAIGKMQEVASE